MARHWREPLDPERHRDYVSGAQDAGGRPRERPADALIPAWTYFVAVNGFTYEFASVEQIAECLAYLRRKTHPSTMEPGVDLEHYWQRWYERLPKGLLAGAKRERTIVAFERALAEFRSAR